ncbi:MAG TPA: ribonuclease III domain-containing protein [Candidatus Limnocylindria bacterium]|nr:ribonuclease III domain-containing protein [Candidatus Limnocylindria bacterium]
MSEAKARELGPLQLAFIGDAVFSLRVRVGALAQGKGVRAMHMFASTRESAASQANALEILLPALTEPEREIVRRGRNAHAGHQAPRSATTAQYSASTGLEALIGYIYLTGQEERLDFIMGNILGTQGPLDLTEDKR